MKKIILFGIILFLLVPTITMAGRKYDENQIMEGILKEVKGEFYEGDINMGGVIIDDFLSLDQITKIGNKIKNIIDINEELQIERLEEESFNQVNIYGYDKNNNEVTIIVSSYIISNENEGETSLFINLIKREQNFSIDGIIEKVEGIFKDYRKPLEITTYIIGTIDEELKEVELNKRLFKAMRRYKAKVREEYIEESLLSYTAYTPLIDKSIFSDDKKVNLNIAVRYNEDEKTYIWIGTPIITTGY